ncbi:MAG: RNA polymerase sigma factor [Salinibacter sp.]|uniref:RNA polymerase sigma factor n=1 Tax=Salinibacter sp. TaxID=2065818 RepID=UPI0035D4FFF4
MPDAPPFEEWCRRLKASDRSAYAELFEEMYEPLFRYVRSIVQGPEAARDVTQDVFIRLWDARASLVPERSLEAYLYRMARNRAYNHERTRRTRAEKEEDVRDKSAAQPAPLEPPDAQAAASQFEDRLWQWIGELPDRQREALTLSRFEGLSHDEIAEVMGISPRTVNNHIVRALKHLRERIRDHEPNLLDRDEH